MKELKLRLFGNVDAICLIDSDSLETHGKPVILIYGPGSMIIQFFSPQFRKENIFVIFDDYWTSEKDKKLDEATVKAIENIQAKDEVTKINAVAAQLKKALNCEKIGLLGFSSLAVMAIKIASDQTSSIDFIIGIGCPVYPIDKFFQKTLPEFLERSSPERKNAYETDQQEYQKVAASGRLSPNSLGVFGYNKMGARFYSNYNKFNSSENWRFGITKNIFDPTMRGHFFDDIFPALNIDKIISENTKPTLLFFGAEDGIVPPPKSIFKQDGIVSTTEEFALPKSYTGIIYQNCGHYPMEERAERFDLDVQKWFKVQQLLSSYQSEMPDSSTGRQPARNLTYTN